MINAGCHEIEVRKRTNSNSKPDQFLSQVKAAPTGVDEQAGLLLMNPEGQMATVML